MDSLTILHNPRCSKSRHAVEKADELGLTARIRLYLEDPLSRDELHTLLEQLTSEPSTAVRRDALWAESGLTDADVASAEAVAELLADQPALLERPILIAGNRAAIGRPTDVADQFLTEVAAGA